MRDFVKQIIGRPVLGKYLPPDIRRRRIIICSSIVCVYIITQIVLLSILKDNGILAFNFLPIIITAFLLGTWAPLLAGLLIYIIILIFLLIWQLDNNWLFGIGYQLGAILLGMNIGWITDLAGKLKISEANSLDAKKRAEEANQSKSEYLARISHEIRTPMNLIIGYANLLKDKITDPDQLSDLSIILKAGNSLINLINDLLDLSKIEAAKTEIIPINFKFEEVFHLVYDFFSLAAINKKIDFSIKSDPSLPPVLFGDEKRIKQILINVIGNALKFTHQGSILVTCTYQDGEARISVKDTGIGIPPEKQEEIFSPFCQGDSTIADTYKGTGLGLTISKSLAELMGGSISLESAPGKGSLFKITLPLRESSQVQNPRNEQLAKVIEFKKNSNNKTKQKYHFSNEKILELKELISELLIKYKFFNPTELVGYREKIIALIPESENPIIIKLFNEAIAQYDDQLFLETINQLQSLIE